MHRMVVVRRFRPAASAALERIENPHVQMSEISFVSRRNDQAVNSRGRGNHRIFQQLIRLSVHHAAPLAKARRIHRKNLIRTSQLIRPLLDLAGLPRVLAPRPLNSCLQFAHRDRREKQLFILLVTQPASHCPMRMRFAKLGNNISIEQISIHLNSSPARRRAVRAPENKFSNRASGASNTSLRLGRAALCSRFHSSIGTRTAVSIPRRVTTCGPFLMVAFNNSLKRAFASCTCQEATSHLRTR
jgi:hypothetical protein